MDGDSTHFNVIVVGTGLTESVLAAALAKAGYSIVQLDQQPYYGDNWASLSLSELVKWCDETVGATCSVPSAELLKVGQRFSLSLQPTLLRATGDGIDVLVKSKVAAYLQFGLLSGVGLWEATQSEVSTSGRLQRVPASKADVFNDTTLSLIEKRRLTKLLLFTVGEYALEANAFIVADPSATFLDFLAKGFSLQSKVAQSLAYALALCSSENDLALPALHRLRSFLRSTGRYGPSPFLVGHYGGAGDLVGGFSRVCAVWGGGQILGRPILPLVLDPPLPIGPGSVSTADSTKTNAVTRPLGIAVAIDSPPVEPTLFTADWVIASPSHLPTLFPSTHSPKSHLSVHAIIVLPSPLPFTNAADTTDEVAPRDKPDSSLFVFEPKILRSELGTVTVLQVGSGTFACPEGYFVIHLQAPILVQSDNSAESLLSPYVDALLSIAEESLVPSFSSFYFCDEPFAAPVDVPANFIVPRNMASIGTTSALATSIDEAVLEAERIFWIVVGEKGRKEGLQFFPREVVVDDEEV